MPSLNTQLKRATRTGLSRGQLSGGRTLALTILLTNDERLQALNKQHRGRNKPTNVLSFPAANADYLGDIAIAHGVAAQEAKTAGKPFPDHAVHLAVHGVLHLLGYDHVRARDAERMEALEIEILAEMGIPDPYRRNVV